VTIQLRSSELARNGIDPRLWPTLNFRQRKAIGAVILSQRGDARSRQVAFLLETNNPNATSGLTMAWDNPQR
jgi:hypothetical protein